VRLEPDTWRSLFESFTSSAFRLETLPVYDMAGEREEFVRHLSGERPPPDLHYGWLDTVANGSAAGKQFQRARVVRSPLSDYITYEFAWGYVFNVRTGEDIRIIDLAEQPDPGLPAQDFWLLDDSIVVRMDYEQDGTQLGRELLDGVDPAPYVEWKHLALGAGVPFTEYYAKLGG
jgi:hypothetical protein